MRENAHVPDADFGFITMAFGAQKYFDQAETLARSLRRHMPGYRIALLTDRDDAGPLFDETIKLDSFKVAGTLLKIRMYRLSPFQETFFIDSDCIVSRDFSRELSEIRQFDFSPTVSVYLEAGDQDLWLRDVGEALEKVGGKRFPKFNGGVYFFRRSPMAEAVFDRAHAMLDRTEELGILDFDDAGPGEETLIGLALAELGVTELYDDGGFLMRTPLNSSGPIQLDVIEGNCSFVKEGQRVEPAICHFCGPWISHPVYRIARQELIDGRKSPPAWRLAQRLRAKQKRLMGKLGLAS